MRRRSFLTLINSPGTSRYHQSDGQFEEHQTLREHIVHSLTQSQTMLSAFLQDAANLQAIEDAASLMVASLRNGHSIYSCGNGGSMSDAIHFAAELSGRYRNNRSALSATAISDPGHITCVANDFGYEHIFSRYLEANARAGDCLLAISTSGKSQNVINAVECANRSGIRVISLTGKPNSDVGRKAAVDISVGTSDFADRIQEMHIKIIHILVELIERELCPENY
jgi:D-sedoheptulose 7-phosphate isomerase